jgi:mono/diheme cytochrome c family protein
MPGRIAVTTGTCVLAWVIATAGAAQSAQSGQASAGPAANGADLFRTYCAACHGREAKGDGPVASSLRKPPPDLTLIAQRNGGTFAPDLVYRIVDGRSPVAGHGGGDMPVWGDAFSRSREGTSEEAVKMRVDALVSFLRSIQARPAP